MKVAVWGAGHVGTGLVRRLATTDFVSEVFWLNRNWERIAHESIDIEHGLAFAPTCRNVEAHSQEAAAQVLPRADLLILTLGVGVKSGQTRAELYPAQRELFRTTVIPALARFPGIVLVVTNPVDLMARLVHRETGLPSEQVLGLGTTVETARLRASLAGYLSPKPPAREVWAYAVGTHDEHFVPIVLPRPTPGAEVAPRELQAIVRWASREVTKGATRVKAGAAATLHPIVEAAVDLTRAIALDSHCIRTPSVLDPDSPAGLFYSVPCTLGRGGLVRRHTEILQSSEIAEGLKACRAALEGTLRVAGEL
ncbi:MAG TPA: hypothetical protein VF017_22775 [Thermoanaerobaculia bacterium]|nr:hypothetical protein [Thermoanaerobaculia bacterium]